MRGGRRESVCEQALFKEEGTEPRGSLNMHAEGAGVTMADGSAHSKWGRLPRAPTISCYHTETNTHLEAEPIIYL